MNTRIVMSFPMARNGWSFSHWLWLRLKRHYGLHEVGDVYNDYLDNVDVPLPPGELLKEEIDYRDTTVIRPRGDISVSEADERDSRDASKEQSLVTGDWSSVPERPIGRRRGDWEKLFALALSQAQVGLVVMTAQYENSAWCRHESELFDLEQKRRTPGKPLRIVVLCMVPLDTTQIRGRLPNAEIIYTHQHFKFSRERSDTHPEDFEPLLTDKEHWKITEEAYGRLLQAIGPLA